MKAGVMIKKLRAWKGPFYGGVLGAHDVQYFRLHKADVLEYLKAFLPDSNTGLTLSERFGHMYLEAANDYAGEEEVEA